MPSLEGGKGSSFQGFVPPDEQLTLSLVGIEPDDSSAVIGYQVDEFPYTWSVDCFVA